MNVGVAFYSDSNGGWQLSFKKTRIQRQCSVHLNAIHIILYTFAILKIKIFLKNAVFTASLNTYVSQNVLLFHHSVSVGFFSIFLRDALVHQFQTLWCLWWSVSSYRYTLFVLKDKIKSSRHIVRVNTFRLGMDRHPTTWSFLKP